MGETWSQVRRAGLLTQFCHTKTVPQYLQAPGSTSAVWMVTVDERQSRAGLVRQMSLATTFGPVPASSGHVSPTKPGSC